jgi:predicted O-linked N-acetylglucosamine transferase (SPINDLY family)
VQLTLAEAFARALAAERRGDQQRARALYDDILAAIPDHPGALLGIARHARARRDAVEARALLARAVAAARAMHLPDAELWTELGYVESDAHDPAAARSAFARALAGSPRFLPALLGDGDAALATGDWSAAEAAFRAAVDVDAAAVAARAGLAQALAGQRRFDEANGALAGALAAAPAARATRAAAAWIALQANDWRAAELHCRAGLADAPGEATLLRLLGQALRAGGSPAQAIEALEAAVAAQPHDPLVLAELAAAVLDAGDAARARGLLERAVEGGDTSAETQANLGLACLARDDYAQAASALSRAVAAKPALTSALADLATAQRYLCAWNEVRALDARLAASAEARIPPFVALALPLSAAQRLHAARRWSQAMLPPAAAPIVHARGQRLRIGYLSGDFREHPAARVLVGLIEAHDRARFTVFGYSHGTPRESPLRRRVVAAFDHWRELHGRSDADVAAAIRGDRIDVLIDCNGHTRGARLAPLAQRPASVQLHYMGFPGTLGYDAIDGLIADAIVVPPGDEAGFHERVLHLPRCYFATDRARPLPDRPPRAAHGLPDAAIVLASLNQPYKLTADVFATWMEALRIAPRSVLWLLASHPRTQANLCAHAERAGVAAERLVFAPPLPQDAHIARLRCADLALDTLPIGSHTTGVDALWAGVPLLSCRGASFAGRVGASLLAAVDLAELAADSLDDYRDRLLDLVGAPQRLRDYAAHLARGRDTLPLWDTRAFAADFDALLARAYEEIVSARAYESRTLGSELYVFARRMREYLQL